MTDVERVADDVKREEPKHKEREPFLEGENAPTDKWNLVYWIVLLHGIGTLMPWNMFINIAPSYYVQHKMVDIGGGPNGTDATTWYSDHFMHYLGICSQVPNLLLNLINIFVPVKGELTPRITISLAIVGAVVAFTDAFVYIDTNTWISGFFWMTMLSIAVLNGANGVYQNSIYGMASDFPFKYTNAVIIGNNLCGTFVAIVSIVAASVTDSKTNQAFGYFTVSLITIVCCFFSFFKLKSLAYYKYHAELGNLKRSKDDSGPPTLDDYIATFKQGWQQFMNVFIVFFVTLTIFPSIMVYVRPHLKGSKYDFVLPETQYINFCVFLLFNVFAFLGSLTANHVQFPKPKGLWVVTWARVLLIPLFMFCNFRPETRVWGVWFESYYIYIFAAVVMSFTSGYLSSLGMMYAPRVVDESKSRIAGMMAAFFLILGIVLGLFFTIFIARLVDA